MVEAMRLAVEEWMARAGAAGPIGPSDSSEKKGERVSGGSLGRCRAGNAADDAADRPRNGWARVLRGGGGGGGRYGGGYANQGNGGSSNWNGQGNKNRGASSGRYPSNYGNGNGTGTGEDSTEPIAKPS